MGLGLPAGGHLTHGHTVSITGKYFKSVPYGVRRDDHRIDIDQVRELAKEHEPKLLWCGTTAYPRTLDFAAFRAIADEVGAILAADIAHIAGLVARGVHPSPDRHRRRRHVDDAQDVPRPARRDDPLQGGARERRSTRPSSPAFRAGRTTTHRGDRRRRARGRAPRVQARTRTRVVENAKALARGARRSAASASSPAAPTTTSCSST